MLFGHNQSESPRVPSPWIANARPRGSARTSPAPQFAAAGGASGTSSVNNPSPTYSPLSRAARLRNAERVGGEQGVGGNGLDDEDEDSRSGSLTSTPLTEEDEDLRLASDEVGGFFALDGEMDSLQIRQSVTAPAKGHYMPSPPHTARHLLRLAPEPDMIGNLEYKLRIVPPTRQRYDKLLTQLKWRLLQGGGECTYEIGLLDDGQCLGICPLEMRASVRTLAKMAKELGANVRIGKAFFIHDAIDDSKPASMTVEEVGVMLLEDATQPICTCGVSLPSLQDALAFIQHEGMASNAVEWLSRSIDADDGAAEVTIELNDSLDSFTEDESADAEARDTTFSLSLDEKATRSGIGFRRRGDRKTCRYNVKNATSQKTYVTSSSGAAVIPDSQSETETGSSGAASINSPLPVSELLPCTRVLVEATLSHGSGPSTFIDYGSF